MNLELPNLRMPRATRLLRVLFVCLLAIPLWASDNDPDWGLPGPLQAPTDKAEGLSFALAVSGDFVLDDLAPAAGQIDLAVDGASGFELLPADTSVDPLVIAHPSGLRHQPVAEGQALQGAADLTLGDGLHATLRAPSVATASVALLTIDVGQGLESVVENQGLGIVALMPLGDLEELDLGKLQALVAAHAAALEAAYGMPVGVSVLVLSVDGQGGTHVSGARVTTDGGAVEVLAE
ncbi:MAG: hypothetical protein H6825_00820 [Planctomycetes bacterium]|nr:hypothetical protein [Planctomycetota bacterium]